MNFSPEIYYSPYITDLALNEGFSGALSLPVVIQQISNLINFNSSKDVVFFAVVASDLTSFYQRLKGSVIRFAELDKTMRRARGLLETEVKERHGVFTEPVADASGVILLDFRNKTVDEIKLALDSYKNDHASVLCAAGIFTYTAGGLPDADWGL